MPAVTGKVEGKRMKKILIAVVPFMLAGCSYYNQFVERMQNGHAGVSMRPETIDGPSQ